MDRCWSWLSSVVPRSSSVPTSLLTVLLVYSFSSQFLPIEPYLVPYLTSVKKFTNYQGQLLALQGVPYDVFFVISFTALGLCFIMTFFFPKDNSLRSLSSLTTFWAHNKEGWAGWQTMVKETWHDRTLLILSLWWAIAFAGFSLVQNYGTNLFDAIDSKSKLNGHILAASQAAGSLGSYSAVYIENLASKSGLFIYVLGSALMGVICLCMGVIAKLWAAYLFYVTISGIYQALACLVSVRCSRLLPNGQFMLLFSINNFTGLLLETLLQAVVELFGLSIFAQFMFFSGFFTLSTVIFVGFCFIDNRRKMPSAYMAIHSEPGSISDNI